MQGSGKVQKTKNKRRARKRRDGNVVQLLARSRSGSTSARVHHQKVFDAQVLPFPLDSRDKRRPVQGRDTTTLAPLGSAPLRYTNIRGHLRDGVPVTEYLADGLGFGFHAPLIAGDGLSRQAAAGIPATTQRLNRTIRPMG